MTTRAVFLPLVAELPSENFPFLSKTLSDRPVLVFPDSGETFCFWTVIAPTVTPPISPNNWTLKIYYLMETATTGLLGFYAQVETTSVGDSYQIATDNHFAQPNLGLPSTVPTTAGQIQQITIPLTIVSPSVEPGDYLRFKVVRNGDGTLIPDTALGACTVLSAEWRTD